MEYYRRSCLVLPPTGGRSGDVSALTGHVDLVSGHLKGPDCAGGERVEYRRPDSKGVPRRCLRFQRVEVKLRLFTFGSKV